MARALPTTSHRLRTRAGATAIAAVALIALGCQRGPRRASGRRAGDRAAGHRAPASRLADLHPLAGATLTATAATGAAAGSATAQPQQRARLRRLVEALSTLAGANLSGQELDIWTTRLARNPGGMDQYIDNLLSTQQFSRDLMSSLLFGMYVNVRNYYAIPSGFTLKHTDAATPIYYLRHPCKPSQAVSVHPWWNLSSEVKVCPLAYKPQKWDLLPGESAYHSKMPLTCDGQVGSPEKELKPICGCGPNLIRCMRDFNMYLDFEHSIVDEVKDTVRYVVENDLPLETLFSGDYTFRDRNAELLYRRRKIGALHLANVPAVLKGIDKWPKQGKWAPLKPFAKGQYAGLLTASQILHFEPDMRQRERLYFEVLWCQGRNSFGATTKKIFQIFDHAKSANLDFVHDTWKRIAHTPICMNCHARMDYGFQFFLGYPDSRAGTHYMPALATPNKTGPLFDQDIHDQRGTAKLTPASFAKLATQQPEFHECMTKHIVSYVLGDDATPQDYAAVQTVIETKHAARPAMKVALKRYVDLWKHRHPDTTATEGLSKVASVAPAKAPKGEVAIGPALHAQLKHFCLGCHDGPKFINSSVSFGRPFDFHGKYLPRELVVRMTDHTAYGMMPRAPTTMNPAQRRHIVDLMIASLWKSKKARREAARYYLGQMRGLPAQQIDNALGVIAAVSGGKTETGWGLLERSIYMDQASYTPGYAATTALQALYACKSAGRSEGQELARCLKQATSVRLLSRKVPK